MVPIIDLPPRLKKHCTSVLLRLVEHCGIGLCHSFVLELEDKETSERVTQSEIKETKIHILSRMNASFKADSPMRKTQSFWRRQHPMLLSLDAKF